MEDRAELTFKVLIVGESTVGKSSLLVRFADDYFSDDIQLTIGVDCRPCYLEVKGRWIKLKIWDTAGQEKYRSITKCFYHGAHGAFVVYDITTRKTLEDVIKWIKELRDVAGDIPIILVGNKDDAIAIEDIQEDASILANEMDCKHYVVSALNGKNVQQAFIALTEQMMDSFKCYEVQPRQNLMNGEEERSCSC